MFNVGQFAVAGGGVRSAACTSFAHPGSTFVYLIAPVTIRWASPTIASRWDWFLKLSA
jgi:hypothetical protein